MFYKRFPFHAANVKPQIASRNIALSCLKQLKGLLKANASFAHVGMQNHTKIAETTNKL
jgi:hypothetical protein